MEVASELVDSPTLSALRAARGGGRRRVKRLAPSRPGCAIGYLRVSTEEQAVSGLGLDAQRTAIVDECQRRGLELCAVYLDEGVSGTVAPDRRPGLAKAIRDLDKGEGQTLMVAKIDRLGRNLRDLSVLTGAAARAGWEVVALNCPLDMTTPSGRAMAQMMGLFAELEREMISDRTRAALAVRKSQGVQLGRPSQVSNEARARLVELRGDGLSWAKVANRMNAEGWPSGSGVPAWQPATARRLCM